MTVQLLILFLIGIAFSIAAYFLRQYPTWRNILAGFGILSILVSIGLTFYFVIIVLQAL